MRRIGAALLSLGVFLVVWKLVTVIGDYPEYILPAPEVVLERALRAISTGILWEHTSVTLLEMMMGFTVGAAAAIATGTLLGKSLLIERILSPENRDPRTWHMRRVEGLRRVVEAQR